MEQMPHIALPIVLEGSQSLLGLLHSGQVGKQIYDATVTVLLYHLCANLFVLHGGCCDEMWPAFLIEYCLLPQAQGRRSKGSIHCTAHETLPSYASREAKMA